MTDERERNPELPGRLLLTERDALIPLLRQRTDDDYARPVEACPGWSVRDVLAHCSAVLKRVVEGRYEPGVFTPENNARDIAERAAWSNAQIVDELERGMTEAGPVMAGSGADGRTDLIALGEWVHAGDVREALGEPGAYGGAGLPYALALLAWGTQMLGHVPLQADLDDVDEPLRLGGVGVDQHRHVARFIGDSATLVRLYAGRSTGGAAYELTGVEPGELNIFG